MKVLKSGKLFHYPLTCPDLERFFLRRLFRKLGIPYVPITLFRYDRVFLREDRSKYNRVIVEACRRLGIETYVVQEGDTERARNPWGHLPLKADYFLCPRQMRSWWISKGMPKDRIKTFSYVPISYKNVLFLRPFYLRHDFLHPSRWNSTNTKTMRVIDRYLDKDMLFVVHPKNRAVMERFIPQERIVEGASSSIIRAFPNIFCFSTSSIRKDCEMLGKKYTLVDK